VLELFPETKSGGGDKTNKGDRGDSVGGVYGTYKPNPNPVDHKSNQGSAARFFYCPKASKKDRNEGCEELENGNNHATVKPTALMAYLCRLITPTGGTVLDPYMGSGSTGKAAVREGFSFVGIELDPDYYEIAKARVNNEL
jgi:site-specific DNA-methyltransferase (adenine-specific)